MVVASGATFPAALLWARLIEGLGVPAAAITPYELEQRRLPATTVVVLLSMSGRHHDTLRALRVAHRRGHRVIAVAGDESSPLAVGARGRGAVALSIPSAGGLAIASPTQSLGLAVAAVSALSDVDAVAAVEQPAGWAPLSRRPRRLFVVGAGYAAPAARDLYEKAMESGYAMAACTDARNLAHGALMGIHEPRECAVVVFGTGSEARYLVRFASELPTELDVVRVLAPSDGAGAALALLSAAIRLFAASAAAHGVAPGLDDVPTWGMRLHRLAVDDA